MTSWDTLPISAKQIQPWTYVGETTSLRPKWWTTKMSCKGFETLAGILLAFPHWNRSGRGAEHGKGCADGNSLGGVIDGFRTRISRTCPNLESNTELERKAQRRGRDGQRLERDFKPGDSVHARNFRHGSQGLILRNTGLLTEVAESPRSPFVCEPRLYHTLQTRKPNGHRNRSNSIPIGCKAYTQGHQWQSGLRFGTAASYLNLEKLGEGSYSTVYKGISRINGNLVALKVIKMQEEEGVPFTAIREASLLKGLKHSNIVLLHDIIHTQETLTFVFEYVQTDLAQYMIQHPGGLHTHNVKLFLFQLLRGLGYIHHCHILHRDLKPQNLLISCVGELKLADFGLARAKSVPSQTYSSQVVTLWYRPPDVLLGATDYSVALDICAQVLGFPTEETWPGVSALPNYSIEHFIPHPPQKLGQVWKRLGLVPQAESLTSQLLQSYPRHRSSAEEALVHEYFSSLPPALFQLPDMVSIFSVAGVRLEPEARNAFHPFRKVRCSSILA
ncbi:cyclin-dependent kinase 15 [Mustelus asterias]